MQQYPDDLVELANQAWILNFALAELHRFKASVEQHLNSEPATVNVQAAAPQPLTLNLAAELVPAIERLTTRLQALLAKWQRRIDAASPQSEPVLIETTPWGCRLEIPQPIRQQMQVKAATEMRLAEAEALAARYPDHFFTLTQSQHSAGGLEADDAATDAAVDEIGPIVSVTRYSGVHLSVAKMWWSWWAEGPRCRLRVLGANLWQIDTLETAEVPLLSGKHSAG